ncbi:hypothetical protein Ddye_029946 [Dipteronia dyeriana]|uniref:Uncharacterized protein n=1 Tax=Dipteronia dyeriana TaxID=168575 RepID=A0AAD9TFD1_9ROSI|nr:hypothetical protein Ddye_029946 [Dipteronia dyeriana]
MGKKKAKETGAATKVKAGGKDASKDGRREKLSVSAMLAIMDEKLDKPKKDSSSTSSKPKAKAAPKVSSNTDGIDLPPSDDEEEYGSEEEQQ